MRRPIDPLCPSRCLMSPADTLALFANHHCYCFGRFSACFPCSSPNRRDEPLLWLELKYTSSACYCYDNCYCKPQAVPVKYSAQWKAGKRSMKYTVFSVTSTHGSMYRMAQQSFQGHVMPPSLRPNFQSFLASASSSAAASPPLLFACTTSCNGKHRRMHNGI